MRIILICFKWNVSNHNTCCIIYHVLMLYQMPIETDVIEQKPRIFLKCLYLSKQN